VVEIPEPVLLVAMLSPGKPRDTWRNARTYATTLSVQEILVVHTVSIGVQLVRREPDGSWPDVPLATNAGEFALICTGFRVRLEDPFAGTRLAEQARRVNPIRRRETAASNANKARLASPRLARLAVSLYNKPCPTPRPFPTTTSPA
jgi:hypothetical protein